MVALTRGNENTFTRTLLVLAFLGIMAGKLVASEYPKLILSGDHPDPSIVRDGEDYYMIQS